MVGEGGGAPEVNNLVYTKRQKHIYAISTHETTELVSFQAEFVDYNLGRQSSPPPPSVWELCPPKSCTCALQSFLQLLHGIAQYYTNSHTLLVLFHLEDGVGFTLPMCHSPRSKWAPHRGRWCAANKRKYKVQFPQVGIVSKFLNSMIFKYFEIMEYFDDVIK